MSKNTNRDKNAGPGKAAGAGNSKSRGQSSRTWKRPLKQKSPKVNKKYKDRLFRFIFLKLYNDFNKTTYTNLEKIEMTPVEYELFKGLATICANEHDPEQIRIWAFNEGKEEGLAEAKAKAKAEAKAEAIIEGRKEGEDMLADLLLRLNAAGRFDEYEKVLTDKVLRQQLLEEFRIVRQSTPEE